MNELSGSINKIESELTSVITLLEEVNDENFDKKMERLQFLQDKISKDRNELLLKHDRKILKDYNINFNKYIKEITERFDNIIRQNKKRQKRTKNELSVSLNTRKLLNYQR